MPVRLQVTNQADTASEPDEYVFEEDHVTIGRGTSNHLTLPDKKRIVSSEHAELRRAGSTYQLVDLGSKNFTYLNGDRLTPREPRAIQSGDTFRIGDFEIEFETLAAPQPATERTVFAADFSNPFEAPAAQLVEALEEILEAYEDEADAPRRRADALQDAFRDASKAMGDHEAAQRVAQLLGLADGATSPSAPRARATAPSSKEAAPDAEANAPPEDEPDLLLSDEPTEPPPAAPVAPSEAIGSVLDAALAAVARLVNIPWQFRHEFIGQTIMQSSETAFLYRGDADSIKQHLLDPSLSSEERTERIDRLREAAEAVAVHQVAMLNGYKASVMQGAQELLEEIDPDTIEADVAAENKLFELFPWLASPVVVERLRATWDELQASDWSVAEQRIFRPAFIKAYLARMTAVRNSDKDT